MNFTFHFELFYSPTTRSVDKVRNLEFKCSLLDEENCTKHKEALKGGRLYNMMVVFISL
jgi:hypothetical protein